jgi:hypothetical protein
MALVNRMLASVLLLIGVGAGCGAAAASSGVASGPAHLSVVAHPTQLDFITASGASSQPPHGPLVTGDRVLGRDDLLQAGTVVGHDDEVCTVTFDRYVLCDDMLSFRTQGNVRVTWTFQWPASGSSGPSTYDGVIEGGTGSYRNARGDFHAVALPNRDVQFTATITR